MSLKRVIDYKNHVLYLCNLTIDNTELYGIGRMDHVNKRIIIAIPARYLPLGIRGGIQEYDRDGEPNIAMFTADLMAANYDILERITHKPYDFNYPFNRLYPLYPEHHQNKYIIFED